MALSLQTSHGDMGDVCIIGQHKHHVLKRVCVLLGQWRPTCSCGRGSVPKQKRSSLQDSDFLS
jgi:hypothetical protein